MKANCPILDNERLDDLELDGLMLIQEKNGYSFTSDSVLLANYIKAGHKDSCVELCAGSGVISLIMGHKKQPKQLTLVELQPEQADRARRSFEFNNKQAIIVNSRLQGVHEKIGKYSFDVCYANPPYRQSVLDSSLNKAVAISTHEIEMTLEDLIIEAEKLLKFGGKFYVVYPASRLAELIFLLKKYKLEPKNLTIVHPKQNKNAEVVLLTAVKGGKDGLVITPSIIEKDENNQNTEMMKSIYNSKV